MSDKNLDLDLELAAPAEQVYEAVATEKGLRGWWSAFADVEERVGGRATFPFPGADFHVEMRIETLEPPRRVEWTCTACRHPASTGFENLEDWKGTTLRFEIEPAGADRCRLHFVHEGLMPLECAGVCTKSWHFYVGRSLKTLVETGRGEPFADEAEASGGS